MIQVEISFRCEKKSYEQKRKRWRVNADLGEWYWRNRNVKLARIRKGPQSKRAKLSFDDIHSKFQVSCSHPQNNSLHEKLWNVAFFFHFFFKG